MADLTANDEMVQGYMDGFDPDSPEPSSNRSQSYRHGFRNGRADRTGKPVGHYVFVHQAAECAMAADKGA